MMTLGAECRRLALCRCSVLTSAHCPTVGRKLAYGVPAARSIAVVVDRSEAVA